MQQCQLCPQIRCSQQLTWKRARPPSVSLCYTNPLRQFFSISQKGHLRGLKPCLSAAGTMTLKTSWSLTWSKILRASVWRPRGNGNNGPATRISEALTGATAFPCSPAGTLKDKVFDNSTSYQNKHLTHNISTYFPFWHIFKSAFIGRSRMT